MGRTPDFFPGQRLEESIRFLSGAVLPAETGVMSYVTGSDAVSGSGLYLSEEGVTVGPFRKLINSESHTRLQQLIHLADSDGPFESFSGAIKDTDTGVFSTGSIWYTDTNRTKKIIDKTITRTGVLPTQIVWNVYDSETDSIVAARAVDDITYSGIFEQTRTRNVVQDPPTAYENVQLWVDANDLVNGTLASGSTWQDKSVYDREVVFVNSPVVSRDWTDEKPKVTLNGTNQYITMDSVTEFLSGSDKPITLVMVYRYTFEDTNYRTLFSSNSSTIQPPYFDFAKGNTVGATFGFYHQGDSDLLHQAFGGASSTDAQVLVFSNAGTAFSTWFNNTIAHNNVSSNATTKSVNLFTIGAVRRAGTPALHSPMEVCEIVIWNKALSATEAGYEYARLSRKWSI